MLEIMIKNAKPRKGTGNRIQKVEITRDKNTLIAAIFLKMVSTKEDNKAVGVHLYARNEETIIKMIQDQVKLYGACADFVIQIPEK